MDWLENLHRYCKARAAPVTTHVTSVTHVTAGQPLKPRLCRPPGTLPARQNAPRQDRIDQRARWRPFGYRYLRKTENAGAAYEIVEHEAALVAELFRRYADDGASIAELTRWLSDQQVPTRTGKARWDRSVVWGMLLNPAYTGRAVFGKTMVVHQSPGLNRIAPLQGRSTHAHTRPPTPSTGSRSV